MENEAIKSRVKANILVVDDVLQNLQVLIALLTAKDYKVHPAPDGESALKSALSNPPDLILLDVRMPDMDGYETCERLKSHQQTRDIPIIFLSALDESEDKLKGFEVGGVDYITKPFQAQEVLARIKTHLLLYRLRNHLEDLVDERTTKLWRTVMEVERLNTSLHQEIEDRKRIEQELQDAFVEIQNLQEQLQAENTYLRQELNLAQRFDDIIGQSEALKFILHRVEQVAPTNTTVLILGETGTGKELIARAIHWASSRKNRPFVEVNCAALPAHLIESELFGHEKGAFTGANTKQFGRFEVADGTTLFLDEIGELPLEMQVKLLRVLQEGKFERLGSSQTIKVDVRIIAATNRDLETEVRVGRFRQDLYYRLNVYPLTLPPLRERPDDIPLLVEALMRKFNKEFGKQVTKISQRTMDRLQRYSWPGNIRELENIVERAVIISPDNALRVELPEGPTDISEGFKALEEMEREYIIRVLESTNWRVSGPKGAAVILGMNHWTLRSRMEKLDIQNPQK